MQTVETLRTERLVAERLGPEHLDDLRGMNGDPTTMATLGGVRSDEETERYLRENLDHWERHGFGIWALRDGHDARFAGRAGLRRTHAGGGDEVELAYALWSEFWGRGLATEVAAAAVTAGFERLGLESVVALTLPTNRASRRVMEKTGFRYERDIPHGGLPHVLYRLPASRWRRDRGHGEARREER